MSKARICDRCKHVFKKEDRAKFHILEGYIFDIEYELCAGCWEEFQKFMEVRNEEGDMDEKGD